MEVTNQYQLTREIIARSSSQTWDEAKLEWELFSIYRQTEPDTCLCGHFPILELCVLRNRINGNEAIVGNVCVKKFLGLPSDLIFQAIARVSKDLSKGLNTETLDHARRKGWINDWEKEFYSDTMRKRSLSDKQLVKRVQINRKIMAHIKQNRQ